MSAEAIEDNLTDALVSSFGGSTANDEGDYDDDEAFAHYDFDETFQKKIAALCMKDTVFVKKIQGLVKPDYFENQAVATIVNLFLEHWERYKSVPNKTVYKQLLQDALTSGKIRRDMKDETVACFKELNKLDVTDRDYVADKVAEFARHQEIHRAMMRSAELWSSKKYDSIADLIRKASSVGINDTDLTYDFFEKIEERSETRKDKAAGIKPPKGITTGIAKIDKMLYHNGWGKSELSVLLGGAKAGKSTGLLFFAYNAALAGHNTLYVTLEMSKYIASERVDALISETEMKELHNHVDHVKERVKEAQKKAGLFYMTEFPTGSLTPAALRRLLESYRSDGIIFDMVVVDYLDLMAPDHRTNDAIENSKNIYVGVRAIAQEEDIALLSATQSNREGFKSVTVKAEHVSDDFNKIRIADLVISINATEEERDRGEARLYFAASRNQAGGVMIQVKQDLERMIFIKSVMGAI